MKSFTITPGAIFLLAALIAGNATAQTGPAKEPDKTVIAVVLGKEITVRDKGRLSGLILGALLDRFAQDNRIEPTEDELDLFVRKTEETQKRQRLKLERDRLTLVAGLKTSTLSARDRKDKETRLRKLERILKMFREMDARAQGMEAKRVKAQRRRMTRRLARRFVKRWKVNKALHAQYGGRVIFQQAGAEPLDAYRDFLRERRKDGAFRILDKSYEGLFWRYFTNDAMHVFYSKADGEKFIDTPWWIMEKPVKKPEK